MKTRFGIFSLVLTAATTVFASMPPTLASDPVIKKGAYELEIIYTEFLLEGTLPADTAHILNVPKRSNICLAEDIPMSAYFGKGFEGVEGCTLTRNRLKFNRFSISGLCRNGQRSFSGIGRYKGNQISMKAKSFQSGKDGLKATADMKLTRKGDC